MSKATPEQTRKANRAAVVVSIIVAAFAASFIGLISGLDAIATERQQEEVVIAEAAPVNPFYVLLIGSDTRKGTALYTGKPTEHAQVDQHSDVMTLMRVDPHTFTISLLTVPRDTVISEGEPKINNALLDDDPEEVVEAVYELTGLRADYYMLTTFSMFADLIDALGGVTMDVYRDVKATDPATGVGIRVKAGERKLLDGAQALAVARARSEYVIDQDAYRQINVRALEEAIIERVLEDGHIGIEALLVALAHDVETDMDLSVLGQTVLDFLDHAEEVTLYSGTGPFMGGPREVDGQWVIDNDVETWSEIMTAFKHGQDFTSIVRCPTFEELEVVEPEKSDGAKSGSAKSEVAKSDGAKKSSGSSSSKGAASSGAASSDAASSKGATSSGAAKSGEAASSSAAANSSVAANSSAASPGAAAAESSAAARPEAGVAGSRDAASSDVTAILGGDAEVDESADENAGAEYSRSAA